MTHLFATGMGDYPTLYIGGLELGMTLLSAVLAAMATFAVVELAARLWSARGRAKAFWLAVGSVSIAAGLWVLALAALLAAGSGTLTQSGGLAWGAAGFALVGTVLLLFLTTLTRRWAAVAGGLIAGAAIVGLHYSALGAARWRPVGFLDPVLAAAAGGLALAASAALVWIAISFRAETGRAGMWTKRVSGFFVALAYAAVPYFAIASVMGLPVRDAAAAAGGGGSGPTIVVTTATALWIAGLALASLALVISVSASDRRARRRRAETEALRRSEDRFRSLAEASAQIVWTTAPDGQMVGPQPSWGEFTGQGEAEYASWGWFSAIHPDDREATAAMWEEALANARAIEMEHRVQRKDGRYRDCIVRMVPVLEQDGRVREWVGTHTDTTDRARARDDRDILVEAGRVLSSSLDPRETFGALAGLLVPRLADWCTVDTLEEDGTVTRALSVHADPHRAELLREIERRFPTTADGPRGVGYVLRTEQSELMREIGEPQLSELAPDEEHRNLLRELGLTSRISVPLTARGQVLGAVTMGLSGEGEQYDLRDLALAEELARRAAIAIDNARLHAQLQNAVRGRDDVLSIVSHDLRNPLHTITMSADLLLEEELPPEQQRKQLEALRRAAKTMNRLIQDLLDVSRSESGRLTVEPEPEDPAALVAEAVEAMSALAERRRQRLTYEVGPDVPAARADRRRVLQVLSNLIGNAIKFTPDGGEIQVRAAPDAEGVHFTVADDGPGIAEEDLPHLFKAHWQAKETAHMGAGLGLAICKGIVEAHGGRIWAESRPGSGSRFHFTIPAAGAEPARERAGAGDGRHPVAVENRAG